MCIFLQDGVLIKPNLPTKKLTWTSNKCFKGRLNFIDILFGENTRFVLLALPATIRYFTNPCYINPCYQQNAQLIKVKESNIKSICRQQLFCSLRAHQHSSNQMKILKDQSAQTTARVVSVACYIVCYTWKLWKHETESSINNSCHIYPICIIYIYIYIYIYILYIRLYNAILYYYIMVQDYAST